MMTREVTIAGKLYAQGQEYLLLQPKPFKEQWGGFTWLAVPNHTQDSQNDRWIYPFARLVTVVGNFMVDYDPGKNPRSKILIMDMGDIDISREPAEANDVEPTGETYSPYQDMDYRKDMHND